MSSFNVTMTIFVKTCENMTFHCCAEMVRNSIFFSFSSLLASSPRSFSSSSEMTSSVSVYSCSSLTNSKGKQPFLFTPTYISLKAISNSKTAKQSFKLTLTNRATHLRFIFTLVYNSLTNRATHLRFIFTLVFIGSQSH